MSRAIRGATARTIHIAPGVVNGHRGGAMANDLPVANRFPCRLLVFYAIVWAVAAIAPRDWPTWALENLLVLPAVVILVATHRRFAFSNASYALITLFLCLHAYGARYGYAHTPAGDWLMRVAARKLAARKLLSRPPHRKRSERGRASGSEGVWRISSRRYPSGAPRAATRNSR